MKVYNLNVNGWDVQVDIIIGGAYVLARKGEVTLKRCMPVIVNTHPLIGTQIEQMTIAVMDVLEELPQIGTEIPNHVKEEWDKLDEHYESLNKFEGKYGDVKFNRM